MDSMAGKKILIVDDEEALRNVMTLFLSAEGFDVVEAETGEQAVELFKQSLPDLVVLDIMLPGMNGYDVCRIMRGISDGVPIIFLTALDDDEHHLLGYRVGADDYIAKPSFKASILAMKVKRILGRGDRAETRALCLGGISLDPAAHICCVRGEKLTLTKLEFALLEKLLENPGRVFTRESLLSSLWGYDYMGEARVVDAMIKKLRKKLGTAAGCIKTVIGVGYKLEDGK